jgi:hypothetical protein
VVGYRSLVNFVVASMVFESISVNLAKTVTIFSIATAIIIADTAIIIIITGTVIIAD